MVRGPYQAALRPLQPAAPGLDGLTAQLRVQLHRHPRHPQGRRTRPVLQRRVREPGHRLLREVGGRSAPHLLHQLRRLQDDVVHLEGVAQQRQRKRTGPEGGPQRLAARLHPHHGGQERAVAEHAHSPVRPVHVDLRAEARHVLRDRGQHRLRVPGRRGGGGPSAGAESERGRRPVLERAAPSAYHRERDQQAQHHERGDQPRPAERRAHGGDRETRLDDHQLPQHRPHPVRPRDRPQGRRRGCVARRRGAGAGGLRGRRHERFVAALPPGRPGGSPPGPPGTLTRGCTHRPVAPSCPYSPLFTRVLIGTSPYLSTGSRTPPGIVGARHGNGGRRGVWDSARSLGMKGQRTTWHHGGTSSTPIPLRSGG